MDDLIDKSSHLIKCHSILFSFRIWAKSPIWKTSGLKKSQVSKSKDPAPAARVCVITSPQIFQKWSTHRASFRAVIFLFAQKGLVPGSMLWCYHLEIFNNSVIECVLCKKFDVLKTLDVSRLDVHSLCALLFLLFHLCSVVMPHDKRILADPWEFSEIQGEYNHVTLMTR